MNHYDTVYFHSYSSPTECDWFKIISIFNWENKKYEHLHINRQFFNDKLNEIRIKLDSRYDYYEHYPWVESGNEYSYEYFLATVHYFYEAHTGIDISKRKLKRWFLSPKERKGSNSFFKIQVRLDLIERPYWFTYINITEALEIYLNTKNDRILLRIMDEVSIWCNSSIYKHEKNLETEVRIIFGINTKGRINGKIDIERLSNLYIKLIDKL